MKGIFWVRAWLLSGMALVLLMVLIGGITRLTGSGLSIVEWNLIGGTIPPLNETQWQEAFEQYKQFPEYQKMNHGMSLTAFKGIFFWEYFHRLIGRMSGLFFLIPFFVFYYKGLLSEGLLRRVLFIFGLGVSQGVMGWLMVASGLVDDPHVSHYRLAAHLFLAVTLLVFIFDTYIYTFRPFKVVKDFSLKIILLSFSLMILIQIIWGAFVAGLKAGYILNTFPLMGGRIFPEEINAMKLVYMNYISNPVTVQFIHRWWGICLLLILVLIVVVVYKKHRQSILIFPTIALLVLLALQVSLGIYTLLNYIPLWAGVLHQLIAPCILLVSLYLYHRVDYGK